MFAVMAMWDPVRLGVAVFVVARKRPVPALFVFCLGGLLSSILISLTAVFLLHGTTKQLIADMNSTTDSIDPGDVKIVIGGLVLVIAVALLLRAGTKTPVPVSVAASGSGSGSDGAEPDLADDEPATGLTARLTARGRRMMRSQSLWMSFLAGVWAGPGPHVELIGALGVILASQACKSAQIAAVVLYAVVSFAFAEIPLLCYLIAPDRTAAYLDKVPSWIRARRIWVMAVALTFLGIYLVASGSFA